MAHLEPSLQTIEFTDFNPFHVAFVTWNHLEPHGALRHVVCQVKTIGKATWHGLSLMFTTAVPCACAPCDIPANLCRW